MKQFTYIAALFLLTITLMSHTTAASTTIIASGCSDSTQTKQDTSYVLTDTLREIEIKANKELRVKDAIDKSLNNGLTTPRQKSLSDIIGKKATDYIMHPTAWKERRREKNRKRTTEAIQKLEAAKSYEDELTEAINRQLREDSIAAARKQQK